MLSEKPNPVFLRFLVGIAAICGLICAACLSALPSTNCPEMADTYSLAIRNFGAVGIISLGATEAWKLVDLQFARRVAFTALTAISLILFIVTVATGGTNIKIATKACTARMTPQGNERMKMLGIAHFWEALTRDR